MPKVNHKDKDPAVYHRVCEFEGCEARFKASHDLKRHAVIHLPVQNKPYPCEAPGCGKAFAQKSARAAHHNSHTKNQDFKCKDCPEMFTDQSACCRHRREQHENSYGIMCTNGPCTVSVKRPEQFKSHYRQCTKLPVSDEDLETEIALGREKHYKEYLKRVDSGEIQPDRPRRRRRAAAAAQETADEVPNTQNMHNGSSVGQNGSLLPSLPATSSSGVPTLPFPLVPGSRPTVESASSYHRVSPPAFTNQPTAHDQPLTWQYSHDPQHVSNDLSSQSYTSQAFAPAIHGTHPGVAGTFQQFPVYQTPHFQPSVAKIDLIKKLDGAKMKSVSAPPSYFPPRPHYSQSMNPTPPDMFVLDPLLFSNRPTSQSGHRA